MTKRTATTNRPLRLSSVSTRGLDGSGARVEQGELVALLRVPEWNTSLAVVETAAGDQGLVQRAWLDEATR